MPRPMLSLSASLLLALASVPFQTAHAQQESTFVSDIGNDANSCFGTDEACRSIDVSGGALSKTMERGVINVLPGNYGGFTIDKAIEILADNGQAALAGPLAETVPDIGGSAKIVVHPGVGDTVRIRGFIIDSAFASGSYGVAFIGRGALHLEDCTIVNSVGSFGIVFAPSGAGELYVSNCVISGNGRGIFVLPSGSGSAKIVLDNVRVENNPTGITIDGRSTAGVNSVTIRNSTFTGSDTFGLNVIDSGSGAVNVSVEGSTFANNVAQGIVANGANVTVRVSNSVITGNGRGLQSANNAALVSQGGNVVAGNTVDGIFTSSVAQK